MNTIPKRALFLIGGLCWILFALGLGFFLVKYLAQGAGLQFLGTAVSSGTVLIGVVHVIGLFLADALCFLVGIGLCVRGLVS